jgi:hypothetical protein
LRVRGPTGAAQLTASSSPELSGPKGDISHHR